MSDSNEIILTTPCPDCGAEQQAYMSYDGYTLVNARCCNGCFCIMNYIVTFSLISTRNIALRGGCFFK